MIRSLEGLASNGKVKSAATRGPGISWLGSVTQAGAFSGFQYLTPPEHVHDAHTEKAWAAANTRVAVRLELPEG